MVDPVYRDRVIYRIGDPIGGPPPGAGPDFYQDNAAASPPVHYQVNASGDVPPEFYEVGAAAGGGPGPGGGGGGGGTLAITSASGTKSHGSTVIIGGDAFGIKASAPPVLWDDCQGTNPLTLWTGAWGGNERYITPASLGRGVAVAHSHRTKYLVGDHSAGNPDAGVWKTFAKTGYFYVSWYMRLDPLWPNSTGYGTDDNNVKPFVYSGDNGPTGPYAGGADWYLSYYGHPSPFDHHPKWVHDANAYFYNPGYPPGVYGTPPIARDVTTTWGKVEVVCKTAADATGSMILYEDGVDSLHRVGGFNDIFAGVNRMIGIGGFSRTRAADSFRYLSDIYIDNTWARVILSTHATLNAVGAIQEVQVPSAWTSSSITITLNHGNVPIGAAFLHVVDATGASVSYGITTVP